jgi:hypothetical protein
MDERGNWSPPDDAKGRKREGRGGANQIRESNKYKFETDEVILAGLTRSDRTADCGLDSDSTRTHLVSPGVVGFHWVPVP